MKHLLSIWTKTHENPLTILLSSSILTICLLNLDFNFLESKLYDLRMSRGFQSKPNSDIVLINIDDTTSKALDEFSPLTLDFHAEFLETLEEYQPRAVGYLVDMNQVYQSHPALFQQSWGNRFVHSAERMIQKGTVFLLGTPFDVTGEILPPFPLKSLPHSVAVIHKDGNVFSEDKVTRRALLSLYNRPAFHLEMAQRLKSIDTDHLPRGHFVVPEVDGTYFFFRYHGNTEYPHRHDSDLGYPMYSFIDILNKKISVKNIQNKILLIGTLSRDNSFDFATTPYSKKAFSNPKAIVHANILDSVMRSDGISHAPTLINWLVTFLVTTIVLWWIVTATPLYGVFATLILAITFIMVSQAFFQIKGLWIRESQPLVGIFVTYYLAVPYRLIREYKKRWDYQRKNEVLTQVEEMKTNFLSLVTHDLKTPVARIQGLTEVLLRNPKGHLEKSEIETLKNVLSATEELNRFISSVLELSKVESNYIHLQIESKDINQLIERSIQAFAVQSKTKNISIQTQLEPLFPIKIDSSLISKVVNNLIDNAIKYSPEHSIVRVETKEDDEWIVISVFDSGIGMSQEEVQNLFTRFYRAKNDLTTKNAGTGLGLYLTKYFIEAHQGRVEVESEKNRGSVFRIFLPISMNVTQGNPNDTRIQYRINLEGYQNV